MAFGLFVPNAYVAGLVGTAFTHTPLFAWAFLWIVYVGGFFWGGHRADADPLDVVLFEGSILQVASSVAGSVVGLMIVWALRPPRLLETSLFYRATQPYTRASEWRAVAYCWTWLLFLAIVLLAFGVFFVLGLFTAMPPSAGVSTGVGIALLVLGAVLVVAACVGLANRALPTFRPALHAAKYTLYFLLLLSVAALNDFLLPAIGPYYQTLVVLGALLVLYPVLAAVARADSLMGEPTPSWRNTQFWLVLALAHGSVYILGALANDFYQNVSSVTWVVIAASGVWVLILAIYGGVVGSSPPHTSERFLPGVVDKKQDAALTGGVDEIEDFDDF